MKSMTQVRPGWALLAGFCAVLMGLASCGGGGGGSTVLGLASLGIDPLGRGEGIDLTQSDYTGRCYEDDALEANRPVPPDPRGVAAEEAEAKAEASQLAADIARDARNAARMVFEASFEMPVDPNPPDTNLNAGAAYVAATAIALVAADAALSAAEIIFFNLADEQEATWADIFTDFTLSKLLLVEFKPELDLGGGGQGAAVLDFLSEAITEETKARILNFLEETRDQALAAFNLAVELFCTDCTPDQFLDEDDVPRVAVADPDARDAFLAAQTNLETAEAQSVADSKAAYEARIFAETAPSDLPPCDSEELRQALYGSFCTGSFVNPVTPEDEARNPGLTERLNAYVDRVCAAVAPR